MSKPRRCSKRWLDADCPAEVLAIMDSKHGFDRYTVFYTYVFNDGRTDWVSYRGMSEFPSSPQGFGISGEMETNQVAAYRYRFKHQYTTWSSLPEAVKALVRRDCDEIRSANNA